MAILTQFEKNRKINVAWLALSFFNFDYDSYINFENESIFSHVLEVILPGYQFLHNFCQYFSLTRFIGNSFLPLLYRFGHNFVKVNVWVYFK